ncbi:MAG: signal peptidase I [Verrucomicrobiaceae bacterium]|nr:signal peptidase I [Verrucomicrobiaceae bacterium]
MFFLTPRYLKQARLLLKGVTRFIDYKRDLLPQAKLNDITALRGELQQAVKARDEKRIDDISARVTKACQMALPDGGSSELADNVEVFFVAIVVALGIRAYIAQPFKIPTGSMQPTLNGYIATPTEKDPTPGFVQNWYDYLLGGRTCIYAVSDHEGYLRESDPFTEHNFLLFFPYTTVHFQDGHTINISSPLRQLIGPGENLGLAARTGAFVRETQSITPDGAHHTQLAGGGSVFIKKGDLLACGTLDSGDHVLVNKFIYNFRSPKRGEVFVFTTKNIRSNYMNVPPEQGSQHYIKRLVGVPGDELEVKSPELWVNGKPAEEFGMKRVASMKEPYRGYGAIEQLSAGRSVKLGSDEYWAMGDNSYNSSDSRYWGVVPQRNLVGPGLFCYLPFTRHWGVIR